MMLASIALLSLCLPVAPPALRCAALHDTPLHTPMPIAMQALWQRLQQLRHDFFLLYLAYHHFRSKVSQQSGCTVETGGQSRQAGRPAGHMDTQGR